MNRLIVCLIVFFYLTSCYSQNNNTPKPGDISLTDTNFNETVIMTDSTFLIGGKWQIECGNDKAKLKFLDKSSASLEIYTQPGVSALFFVTIIETKGELQFMFEGLSAISRYNSDIDWFSLSKNRTIAIVKITENNNITFKWLGFYNLKTVKREFTDNPFDKNSDTVTLKRYQDKEDYEAQQIPAASLIQ